MKRLMIAATVAGAMTCGYLFAQAEKKWEGDEPYTPSKIEWLVTKLNVDDDLFNSLDHNAGMSAHFGRGENPNEVVIVVTYDGSKTPREILNSRCDGMKDAAKRTSERHGFNWVVIKEKVGQAWNPLKGIR
jgi:hypothetical protein